MCFTPGIKFFLKQFEYLLVSLKVELRRIPYMTYKKSVSLTSVFPPLIRPVDLPIHLKQLLTVIIEKNLHCNNESENLPTGKILMKVDLNINLFNSQKTGNCDSENLVSHIFSTQEHAQRFPKKDK